MTRPTSSPPPAGGRGAVREVVEVILKAQGLWHGLCGPYHVPAVVSGSEAGAVPGPRLPRIR